MSILKKIFGDENEKYLKKIQPLADEINKLEKQFEQFSDEELKNKTKEFKEQIKKGEKIDTLLPQAYALVREAAKKTLNQRHFDVQLLGGIALHQSKITEMKTGEGKTLASTLPTYLNALEEKGVHIVTVNEYLAKRDTIWMGQIYYALGLTVGCLIHDGALIYDPNYQPSEEPEEQDKERDELGGFKVIESYLRPASRKEAYSADITYGTNHEFGFDYLRDNMVHKPEQRVQRGLNFAIIDEVDSVLIDEARTPLIISAPDMESSKLYSEFSTLIPRLSKDTDYEIHEKEKAVTLTEIGIEKIEKILGIENIYQEKGIKYLHYLEQALRANVLFQKDRDYVSRNGEIIIVDEFTGRLMPGRRWSGGLHQAVEAKEGLSVKPESLTLASISIQNYFRMYDKLAGMTGTAVTSAEEFEKVYKLRVIVMPTNKPIARNDLSDVVYKTNKEKLKALVERTKRANKEGQPVLIGTRSIEKNEILGQMLKIEGVTHEILNAKHHQREGEIIAQAGRFKAVTVATNMAGRGVDIVFGGNPPNPEEAKKVKELGGLLVLCTERHEARRIDNQLRGRSGRQGDPGETQFFLSMEDDLMRIFGGERMKNIMDRLKLPDDQPIQSKIISNTVESAQAKIEGMNFDARKHLLEYDDVMNVHRTSFYKKRNMLVDADDDKLKELVLKYFDNQEADKENFIKKEKEFGNEFKNILRYICLKVYDSLWLNHLAEMDYLRDRVSLRAYGQMDPLVEYKGDGYKMFKDLMVALEANIIEAVTSVALKPQEQMSGGLAPKHFQDSKTLEQVENRNSVQVRPAQSKKKPGRNDPCPCGKTDPQTGKSMKYKKCCGAKG
ncbi:preprotein translocase subunit SecA [Patescibacteria group bacterium]|nr:preprotein translocase subunit SecA [Patescibacteria group bacterium]MBU4023315.1 preprotein translocase subunit SecA [Patescibacteria group bacterium]MBU4078392.1 preprotein translocase subunit SecA [Patescibacteria group bacterium]